MEWFSWVSDPQAWIALATLTGLELVLGIDNVIFISIIADKLPGEQKDRARVIGLALAVLVRILLLFSLTLIIGLTETVFTVLGNEISWRDIILIVGGLFLLGKSTLEIHEVVEDGEEHTTARTSATFTSVIIQIVLLDIVFSFDSVITAIGMADQLAVMVIAVLIAVTFLILFSGMISNFVTRHPTLKMLSLSFLILIGMALISDGLELHIPKGYIYFAMAFSLVVEILNIRVRLNRIKKASKRRTP
jgi:predicted tellurium resistance membrane protein TerC